MKPLAAALVLALLALAAACKAQEEAPPTVHPTATPSPIPSTGATPAIPRAARAIFLAGATKTYPPSGELWISNLDGSGRRQLTPPGVMAAFAGTLPAKSGGLLIYYVSQDSETGNTLWDLDEETGERTALIEFRTETFHVGEAAVSPSGRYIAYVHRGGLTLLDRANGESSLLLAGSPCEGTPAGRCVYYREPKWSPDGTLLMVARGFYEGGTVTLVDPFSQPPREIMEAESGEGPFLAEWSPSGDRFCAHGRYATSSGLYVAEEPDWSLVNLLPDYEPPNPNDMLPIERGVVDCGWLDSQRILFTAIEVNHLTPYAASPPVRHELMLFNLADGSSRQVALLPGRAEGDNTTSQPILLMADGVVIVQRISYPPDVSRTGQAELIDPETGGRRPILQDGDWLLAVVRP